MTSKTDLSPELVLAPRTLLRPAGDIPGAKAGDLILDCADRRQHAKLVNAAVGALLERFRTPTRLPEAIAAMTRNTGADPFDMLEQAAPVVRELLATGVLRNAEVGDPCPGHFEAGAEFANFRVHKVLRRTVDTEVAMATDADGRPVALKSLRDGATAAVRAAFLREIEMARRLSGTVSPSVLHVLADGDTPVLVTEWIEGLALDRYMHACCTSRADALALAVRVAEAYSRLHARGILHGDIRPSNILVDGTGCVKLIDFGLSQWTGPSATRLSFELSYMEPEAAASLIEGKLPRLTTAGEVCSLGMVLAEALIGRPVRSLPAFRDEALNDIAERSVAIRTGLASLDAVLEAATCTVPARTPNMTTLKDALAELCPGLPVPPTVDMVPVDDASVDTALLMLRAAEHDSSPGCLAAAQRCLHLVEQAGVLGSDKASPLYTPVARALLIARTDYAARRFDRARAQMAALPGLLSNRDRPAELFTGTAGDLAHLAAFYADYRTVDEQVGDLAAVLEDMLERQFAQLRAALSGLERGARTHLGMAHGLCGQLYAILRATTALGRNMDEVTEDGLLALAALADPVGAALAWPGTVGAVAGQVVTPGFAPGWCSGTAGFLLLWIEAARASPDPHYRTLVDASALYTLGHPDPTSNLCCGLAGRATTLSIYGRWIESEHWCEMARQMADSAGRSMGCTSVFRGDAGVNLARMESRSMMPRFPI